jgi:hypothetical protein
MKIKVTNTQTIEIPDDMDPETAAALFENPGIEDEDGGDEEDDLDDENGGDEEDEG